MQMQRCGRVEGVGSLRKSTIGCLAVMLLAGCGPRGNSVDGTVSYQGRPLTSGRIYFTFGLGETVRSARIEPDGSFRIENVPAGEAQVTVVVPPPFQTVPDDPAAPTFGGVVPDSGTVVVIPQRYANISSSGLSCSIVPGEQSRDFKLD